MGVFGLLSLSWKMFKERWKQFVGLTLLSIIISLIPSIINFTLRLLGENSSGTITALGSLIILIFYIPGMLVGIAMIEVMRDKNMGISEAIRGAIGRLLSFFVTMFIGILVMIAVLTINMIIVMGGFFMFGFTMFFITSSSGSGDVFSALINVIIWLLGFVVILLMLLPTFVASIWLYFAQFAVVLENMSPMESLSYSYELMKKKMLSIVWKNIAVAILLMIASALMLIMVLIPSLIIPFLMVIMAIAMIPAVLAVVFIISPVMYLFQYNIYENLKVIKKDKISLDYATKHKGKIKIFAILGALIVIPLILFSVFASSLFNNLENKFINTPYGSYFQNDDNEKDNSNKESENNKTVSEIEKRDEQRISDLDSISLMLWHYKEQRGNYPISDSVINLNENNNITSEIKSANASEEIPEDPSEKYFYDYKSDGETYELSAVFENKNDARCEIMNSFCIYRLKQAKVVQNEEELNLVTEDFSSPEATFNTFLKSNNSINLDLFFKTISARSKKQLEENTDFFSKFENSDEWGGAPEQELKAKYRVVEKTDKFAIMAPELREQKSDYEDRPNGIFLVPDTYFEKEGNYWKIDLFTTAILDVKIRNYTADTEAREESLKELKDSWKSQF
jgi:hypothetical protein